MKFKALFDSKIESRIAIPLILALTLPVLFISIFAMQILQQEALNAVEDRLQRGAKNYGMLILERIERELTPIDDQRLRLPEKAVVDRPQLQIDAENNLTAIYGGAIKTINLALLTADLQDVDGVRRCVSTNMTAAPCFVDTENELSKSWDLRLISQFDTDAVITVTMSLSRKYAMHQIDLITSILPYIITLITACVGYGAVLYLRLRFRPVPRLQQAIKRIEGGQYGYQVDVETNDEFALLGDALNSLSTEIGDAVGFLERTSQIDEKILSGTALMRIFEDICQAAVEFGGTNSAFIVAPKNLTSDHNLVGCINGDTVSRRHNYEGNLTDAPPQDPDLIDYTPRQISSERAPWAWMLVDAATGVVGERIDELIRRAAVAATYHNRSSTLYEQATYDGLTGLLNRIAFVHELERILNQCGRNERISALVFLDLDQFKRINDTEGHTVGDELLRIVAQRLTTCVRETDVVARLGGDEFAIALTDVEDRYALTIALRRIEDAIGIPMRIGRFEHIMGCSMGVCLLPQDGNTTELLLKNADLAMYKAKTISGSAFVFFDKNLNEETERRVLLEGRLRKALQNDELNICLQPKLCVQTGCIDSFEALMRWTDERLGVVSPQEFVDIAERTGLIEPLTELAVRQVAQILAAFPKQQIRSVAINISPAQLGLRGFVHKFLDTLRQHNCDLRRVEVEVTESVLISDPEAARDKLTALRDQGLRVSLDDFGTGFSSLNLLTQLPLDALKIDKSFVDRVPKNQQSTLVVSKIVEMARGLGIDVVAEGVEEMHQIDVLGDMGCTHVQGYAISEALTPDAIPVFLKQWATPNQAYKGV